MGRYLAAVKEAIERRRRHGVEALGYHLYAAARIAPGALLVHVASLGGAVATAARAADTADRVLENVDRRALTRRLRDYRDRAPISETSVQAAAAVAKQIAAFDLLVERRREYKEETERLEPWLKELPGQIFQIRLDREVPPDLVTEVTELREQMHTLTTSLQEACNRVLHE